MFKKGQNVALQIFFTINEKSTILVQFCSNFQGLTRPWVDQSLKVWAKSDKNCKFFINGEKNLHCYILTFLIQYNKHFKNNDVSLKIKCLVTFAKCWCNIMPINVCICFQLNFWNIWWSIIGIWHLIQKHFQTMTSQFQVGWDKVA